MAIIGLGPVGITLANLLGKHLEGTGLTVVGVDASASLFDRPRAIGLDQEALRTVQSLGLADAIAPFIDRYRSSEYHAADGSVLRRFVAPPEPFPLAWPPNVMFVQPDVERILRERARDWSNLTMRLGTAITAIADLETRPVLSVRDGRTGETGTITCRYGVACDGGASFVRKSIGIVNEDLAFEQPWLVVDILLNEADGAAPVELPEVHVQYCDPARPMTFVHGPGRLRRWEIMLLPGDDPDQIVKPERIWQLLAPWLQPDQASIWRAATYRFHALVAESWRTGGILLAGDAAHQMPPFIAQGLNQGLRDAANLAWKLAAVLQGAPPALLDTYEAERRPNVRAVIALTKELGGVIGERDPKLAAERDERMKAAMASGAGTSVRQDLLPPIKHGLIGRDGSGGIAPGAGTACPQPWILPPAGPGRVRLDDILGGGFRVLVGRDAVLSTTVVALATALQARIARIVGRGDAVSAGSGDEMVLVEEHQLFATWMAARSCLAIVVRPDHVVFGGAADTDGLAALLRALLDATHAPHRETSRA